MGFFDNLLGGVPIIGGMITGNNQINQAKAINPVDTTYQTSQYAKDRPGLAQTLLNARMPGAAATERNIYGNEANALGQVNRNASSGAQSLALASAINGQSNNAFGQLGVQEGQNYYNNLNNLNQAQQGMISEGDKVYQDQLRKFHDQLNQKNQLLNAGQQNIRNGWNDAANVAMAAFTGMPSKPQDIEGRQGMMTNSVPNMPLYGGLQTFKGTIPTLTPL